jgi:hypothetical protein
MFNHGPSSASQKANRRLFILPLTICLLFLLSGCKSAELQTLEKSVSILQITTGQEVRRRIQDKGTALGKPVYAEIAIVYEPINNHTTKEVYDEIVAILKKNLWEGSEPNTGRDYFKATLQQDQFKIFTEVLIDSDKNLVATIMTIY